MLDYSNWADDEPEANYGEIDSSDGTWKSGQRWHDRAYICKTSKGKIFLKKVYVSVGAKLVLQSHLKHCRAPLAL